METERTSTRAADAFLAEAAAGGAARARTSRLAWWALAFSILTCPVAFYATGVVIRRAFDPGRDVMQELLWAAVGLMVFAPVVAIVALIRIWANPAVRRGQWVAIASIGLSILWWIGSAFAAATLWRL